MAVTSFIPQIWEARLMAKFHERSVAQVITTAPTKIEGNKIIFNKVSEVAINDYAGSVDFADLATSKVELPMDIKKYFAFKVDDVDAVQAAGALIDPHVEEAGFGLQEAADRAVFAKALEASATVEDAGSAYDKIVKLNTKLNKNKVPKADRFAVINAEVLEELQLDARFTKEYVIMENGIMEGAKINGCQLVFSEELNKGAYGILVMHKSAVGFGVQLQETEAMRLQDAFADGVRGLQVYGTAILREEAVAKFVK